MAMAKTKPKKIKKKPVVKKVAKKAVKKTTKRRPARKVVKKKRVLKKSKLKKVVKKKVKRVTKPQKRKKTARAKKPGIKIPVKTVVAEVPAASLIDKQSPRDHHVVKKINKLKNSHSLKNIKEEDLFLAEELPQNIVNDQPKTILEEKNEQIVVSDNDYNEKMFAEDDEPDSLTLKQKKIIMYTGISCIMLIIVSFWGLSISASIGHGLSQAHEVEEEETVYDQRLKQAYDETRLEINSAKQFVLETEDDLKEKAEQIIIEEKVKDDIAQQVKDKLEQELQNTNINNN